jgi:hypothetical protein
MLRLLVVQNCLGLSDERLEDAAYEIQPVRQAEHLLHGDETTVFGDASQMGQSGCDE